jgi:hypothetical protein
MIRLIVKEVYQPPIDTPAIIRWHTIDVDIPELESKLLSTNSSFQVIGAEVYNKKPNAVA